MIGNSNTGKLHFSGCRAIGMMKESHKIPTEDGEGFSPCGWCHGHGDSMMASLETNLDQLIGDEVCTDPQLRQLFMDHGCECGSHLGDVRMYPHGDGIPVAGRNGLWWVYFRCYECGHESSQDRLPMTFLHRTHKELLNFTIKRTRCYQMQRLVIN